jgi:BatD DUF11 like domain
VVSVARYLILLLFVLLTHVSAVEVKFDVPEPIFNGVVMNAKLTVNNATSRIQDIDLPDAEHLEWQTQRGSSTQMTVINGKRSQSETYTIAFRVSTDQAITFPSITVRFADGSSVQTIAKTLKPELPNTNLSGEAYAEAFFEPAMIVPGEPTTLIYRLYLRQERKRAIKEPSLTPPTDLLSLGERTNSTSTTIDAQGTEWEVQTWRWPLTAAREGNFSALGQQEWYRCRVDLFGSLVAESKHDVAIKPGTLTVMSLPELGRPADFSGLIGPLQASAKLDRTRIATGEGTLLTLTISGLQSGLVRRPAISLPESIQAYAKEDNQDDTGNNNKQFSWDIVPSSAGQFTLPPFVFSYFDPQTKTYRRTTTDELHLEVIPGRQRALVVTGQMPEKQPATVIPVKETVSLPTPLRGSGSTQIASIHVWLAALFMLFIGVIAGFIQRWSLRAPSKPHRGHALKKALASGNHDAIAAAIFALRPALSDEQKIIADLIEQFIDRARFGGSGTAESMAEIAKKAAPLCEVP